MKWRGRTNNESQVNILLKELHQRFIWLHYDLDIKGSRFSVTSNNFYNYFLKGVRFLKIKLLEVLSSFSEINYFSLFQIFSTELSLRQLY